MNLDELLNQPLAPVADNGFSARIMAEIRGAEYRRIALAALATVLATTLVCLLIPIGSILVELNLALVQVTSSVAVSLAVGALVLTYLWDRQYFRL